MNIYFVQKVDSTLQICALTNVVHYCTLSFGDIIVYDDFPRLIMVFFNSDTKPSMHLKELPMVAQAMIRDKIHILPIQFQWNQIGNKKGDKKGLVILKNLFVNNELATQILNEAFNILIGKSWNRNILIPIGIMKIKAHVPEIRITYENEIITGQETINKNKKLLFVEKYFSINLRNEYYKYIQLGYTERQALVAIKQAYPSLFSQILKQFNNDHLPTEIYCLRI